MGSHWIPCERKARTTSGNPRSWSPGRVQAPQEFTQGLEVVRISGCGAACLCCFNSIAHREPQVPIPTAQDRAGRLLLLSALPSSHLRSAEWKMHASVHARTERRLSLDDLEPQGYWRTDTHLERFACIELPVANSFHPPLNCVGPTRDLFIHRAQLGLSQASLSSCHPESLTRNGCLAGGQSLPSCPFRQPTIVP